MTKESNAERQRRYREKRKLDPERNIANKKKDLERYYSKRNLINDKSERSKRAQRKKWCEIKKQQRAKNKMIMNDHTAVMPDTSTSQVSIARKKLNPKERKQNQTKLAREILRLKRENKSLKKSNEKYRKRAFRSGNLVHTTPNKINLTPKSSAKIMLKECFKSKQSYKSKKIARKLFEEHAILVSALRKKYSSSNIETRSQFRSITRITEKYRSMRKIGFKCFGLKGRTFYAKSSLRNAKKIDTMKKIEAFFNRDDVSRATSGKKETVTRYKVKQQKRYLLDTIVNLHKKYKQEGGTCSFQTFAKYRPFNVIHPNVKNRDTCLCWHHSNIRYKLVALYKLGLVNTICPEDLVSKIGCDRNSKSCMYNECHKCKDKLVPFIENKVLDENTIISCQEWVRKKVKLENKETDEINEKKKEVTKITKENKTWKYKEFVRIFQQDMTNFKKHVFNIQQQYKAYRMCIDNLAEGEVVMHIDFSENYNCKLSEEVQSHHFGGSRNQVSLHTAVLYIAQEKKPISCCTISSSLEHGPAAIWAHLEPILQMVINKYSVKVMHVFSDGPCTQYKQKKNFYLFDKYVSNYFMWGTWNFFEANHGKGAADGIGAALKRTADSKVASGTDIPNASEFFSVLKNLTTIQLYQITEEDIQSVAKTIPCKLPVLKGTMTVHQMRTTGNGVFLYRDVSCFCKRTEDLCLCFEKKMYRCHTKPAKASRFKKLNIADIYSSDVSTDTSSDEA